MERLDSLYGNSGAELGPAWYCLRSQPKHEFLAADAFRRRVSGSEATDRPFKVYRQAIKTVGPAFSCRVAEAAKLLENVFRSVNIALVNELKLVYAAMGIDVWEVIEAAKTKPFGFMAFYPGPGLGGHCIPIDPFCLTWKAREFERTTRFIELAGEGLPAPPCRCVHTFTRSYVHTSQPRLRAAPVFGDAALLSRNP